MSTLYQEDPQRGKGKKITRVKGVIDNPRRKQFEKKKKLGFDGTTTLAGQ